MLGGADAGVAGQSCRRTVRSRDGTGGCRVTARSPGPFRAITAAVVGVLARLLGFSGFTIDDVAQTAGVGKAAIYRRWAGKTDLLASCTERSIAAEAGAGILVQRWLLLGARIDEELVTAVVDDVMLPLLRDRGEEHLRDVPAPGTPSSERRDEVARQPAAAGAVELDRLAVQPAQGSRPPAARTGLPGHVLTHRRPPDCGDRDPRVEVLGSRPSGTQVLSGPGAW